MADLSGHAALMSLLLVFLCISYAQVHLHMTCIRSRREQNGLTADKMESMLDLPYEGVQKVRRLTQLTTRYAHHMLSLFNKDTCNWNALGPVFLQRSDTVVEELLFLVLQPAICNTNTNGEYDGWRSSSEILDGSQCLSWPVIRCVVLAPSDFYFFLNWKNSWKETKFSDDEDVICTYMLHYLTQRSTSSYSDP